MEILLIVESKADQDMFLQMFSHLMQAPVSRNEYNLITFQSLFQAIEYLKFNEVDIIISDLNLPDSIGKKTIDYLRSVIHNQPIIMYSSLNDFSYTMLSLQSGFQDYLVKDEINSYSLARAINYSIARFESLRIIKDLAVIDELTEVYNRRGFLTIAEDFIRSVCDGQREESCLLFIDINKFKSINDIYGHIEGDKVLKVCAKNLRDLFKKSDIIARYGGDEFVILASGIYEYELGKLITGIRKSLKEYNAKGENPYELSFSIGAVSIKNNCLETIENIISLADKRMYEDKNHSMDIREP